MSEGNIQGYRAPGDVELRTLHFITQFGNVIDVTQLVDEVNIYQSLFRHYMEADFIFHDTSNFIHELPKYKNGNITSGFSGTEMMLVSYAQRSKGKKERVFTHCFGLHSVKDRQSIENSETYLISGVSLESYNTFTKTLSKTYGSGSGNTIENMIKSIFNEHFKNSKIDSVYGDLSQVTKTKIDKKIETSSTFGNQKFVIPNLTVDDTIDFLARESDSDNHFPLFYFWEDSEKFNFKNVNEIITTEPVSTYYYSHTNVGTDKETDKVHDSNSIVSYKVIRQQDLFGNIENGLYKSQTIKIDMFKKKYNTSTYDYTEASKKFNKLQPKLIPGAVTDEGRIKTLMTTRSGHDSDPVFSDEKPVVKKIDSVNDNAIGFRRSIFNTVIEVQIPADPYLKSGDVIELVFPVNNYLNEGVDEQDKYLTGKYLITKVRQIFSSTSSFTVLECTKDGGLA